MPRHTLYAYVDGFDLDDVAPALHERLNHFVQDAPWRYSRPSVVNERFEDDPSPPPDDLPQWDLGLNLHLPDDEPTDWFADVETMVTFLADLQPVFGRDFVLGIADAQRGVSEDLPFRINAGPPNLALLRQLIGVRESA